jgi:KamA family protein
VHIPQLRKLDSERLLAMQAVAKVLPFRANEYVCSDLIDWDAGPDDPMFQLAFPQPGMLLDPDRERIMDLLRRGASKETITQVARQIQAGLNPHPAGQQELNVPLLNGQPVAGMQHKYRETVLYFPTQGQTCHSYCTYCFRWAQFTGNTELKFASTRAEQLKAYVQQHPEVTDVLLTGGDPLVMRTRVLRRILEPLLEIEHLQTIRIGTKSLAWWPYRFVTDRDADDLLRFFERVEGSGKNLALMAHYTHPRELDTLVAEVALRRVRSTGVVVRCQGPVVHHVNDSAETWGTMWRKQVALGAVPYYMFLPRDTGANHYFKVPLARALDIFNGAYRSVSGLGRTVRGPSMSATPGKILVDGVTEVAGQKVFVLKMVQGRDPEWPGRIFYAQYDPKASWLNELRPAFGKQEFFYEPTLRRLRGQAAASADIDVATAGADYSEP